MKYFIIVILIGFSFFSCASIQAINDLNTLPENLIRGDPLNTSRVQEFLHIVLDSPDEYEIRAFHRKAYSPQTKKTIFMIHYFFVYYKNGNMLHTLVFTDTPKGSERKGTWMFDAHTDVDSYNLYITSDNPWEVEEYHGPNGEIKLNLIQTTNNILDRIDKNYTFFAAANVRNLAWYHQIWMFLVPPPIITYTPLLLISINKDSCASAVVETVVWEK